VFVSRRTLCALRTKTVHGARVAVARIALARRSQTAFDEVPEARVRLCADTRCISAAHGHTAVAALGHALTIFKVGPSTALGALLLKVCEFARSAARS